MKTWKYLKLSDNYIISDEGDIISLNWNGSSTPKQLKPWTLKPKGYQMVSLWLGKDQKKFSVHSLVAETFIGERPEGCVVDHIDFNVTNNQVSNLRYLTHKESNKHRRFKTSNLKRDSGGRFVGV